MLYNKKENNNKFTISNNLSATKPSLQTETQQTNQPQRNFAQKQILLVYVNDDRFYIQRSSAYALGIINTRAIMVNGPDDLIEISKEKLAVVSSRDNIELKFEKITLEKKVPERQKIKIYKENLNHYIDMSAAYALGLISLENFNAMSGELYPISDNYLVFLQNKYDVEFQELGGKLGGR